MTFGIPVIWKGKLHMGRENGIETGGKTYKTGQWYRFVIGTEL